MDTKFQTSFIPKKNLEQSSGGNSHSESVSVFLVVSIVIFIVALASAGGVFAYKKVLIKTIAEMNRNLVEAKNSFEPESVEKWDTFGKRLKVAKKLIDGHTTLSSVFEMLENKTLGTVKFKNFSYEMSDAGVITIAMAGEAKNFSSIALQSDIFGQEKYIKTPVFSELNPDKSGNIVFKFSTTLDPDLVSYRKNVNAKVTP